ncbi:MAG TPA: hypothetical protein VME69_10165, partial [Methylocella sp.]|nr:hypothetical protein [Methylocella sp.]
MSRKNIFSKFKIQNPEQDSENELGLAKSSGEGNDPSAASPQTDRPLAGIGDKLRTVAAPVGSIGRVLSQARERSQRADEIERAFQNAPIIVELDPSDIDPSFA